MRFESASGPREHIPDFLAVTGEGTWLLDVRPAARIEAADRVKFAASAEAALACGWRYGVVAGWQPHVMTTLDTLSAQRLPLRDPLGLTGALLAAAGGGPVRFAELVAGTCYPAVARAFAIILSCTVSWRSTWPGRSADSALVGMAQPERAMSGGRGLVELSAGSRWRWRAPSGRCASWNRTRAGCRCAATTGRSCPRRSGR